MSTHTGDGPADLDLSLYREDVPAHPPLAELAGLPADDRRQLLLAGVDPGEKERSGSFFQMDHSVVHCRSRHEGVEMLAVGDARAKYDGLKDYWWQAVAMDKDRYTRRADARHGQGYFIRARAGAKVHTPLQACLYLTEDKLTQDVHNIVIAEANAELNIITGCATSHGVRSGLHVGVSEFYVQEGATLSFTMIHHWPEQMAVRPRTAVIVEAGGTFISNYICLVPARDIQMYPTVTLRGPKAAASLNSVLMARPGSLMDVGSRVLMEAPD